MSEPLAVSCIIPVFNEAARIDRVLDAVIGHPLLADAVYGGRPALGLQRQALHAVELRLRHPFGGQQLDLSCAPPADRPQTIASAPSAAHG